MTAVVILPFPMNKADSERIHELCSLIAEEQDRKKFTELCQELNQILGTKERRLEEGQPGGQAAGQPPE